MGILGVGVWALNEKDMFNNLQKGIHIALDPAFALIVCGTVTFIIGFTGCVGALRENTCLLSLVIDKYEYKISMTNLNLGNPLFQYSIFLALLLLLELGAGVATFVLRDRGWVNFVFKTLI